MKTENNKQTLINGIAADYLSVHDRAIHYGDGLFETILVDDNQLYLWQQHYQRLKQSAEKLKILCPEQKQLERDIRLLFAENKTLANGHAAVKIILTRGTGKRGYAFDKTAPTNRIVSLSGIAKEYSTLLSNTLTAGKLFLCEQQASINENLAGLKHLNRLENVLARNEWHDDFVEGVMLNANQHVIEGSMSNLFAVKDKQLLTPDLMQSGVNGIMRDFILQLANNSGIETSITNITLNQLLEMDEVFICNSLFGMKSISHFLNVCYPQASLTQEIFKSLLATFKDHVQVI